MALPRGAVFSATSTSTRPTRLQLYRGDFFALAPQLLGPVCAVFDRAALISWAPELRAAYVAHMTALTQPGTQTLLITMEYPQEQMAGPPFSVEADVVDRLYAPTHAIECLSKEDVLANEPRLRSRGITQLHEVCYRLTRLLAPALGRLRSRIRTPTPRNSPSIACSMRRH